MNKILCLVQLPPPLHGVSKMNGYVIKSTLIKEFYDLKVLPLRFSKRNDQLEQFSLRKIFSSFAYVFRLLKAMALYKPDLVYFTLTPTGFAFYRDALYVFLLKMFGASVVLHLHGKGVLSKARESRFVHWLYEQVFRNTNVICLSNKLSDDIREVHSGRVFIVPNGIEREDSLEVPKPQEESKVPQILYLSNYIENKGILVLIDALSILKKQDYRFRARLAGAPSNLTMSLLNSVVKDKNLAHEVEIVGPVYGSKKSEEFMNADIFVLPSYNDAFPLVNIEAMQYSLPVVSTTEGSIPDVVINNETGFIVERRNSSQLAEKISILLKNQELRKSMGKKGNEKFLNEFTLTHFEKNIRAVFDTVSYHKRATNR